MTSTFHLYLNGQRYAVSYDIPKRTPLTQGVQIQEYVKLIALAHIAAHGAAFKTLDINDSGAYFDHDFLQPHSTPIDRPKMKLLMPGISIPLFNNIEHLYAQFTGQPPVLQVKKEEDEDEVESVISQDPVTVQIKHLEALRRLLQLTT